jgi:iron(III) transport system permease protein
LTKRTAPRLLTVLAVIVGAGMVIPVVYLIIRASEAGLTGVLDVVTDVRTMQLLGRTVMLAAAVTAASVVIAAPVAWLTVRSDLPWRGFWTVTTALPLVIPSYVAGFAFVAFFGPRGQVQRWLEPLGVERLPSIYGFWGAWLVLTLFTYPYVLLTIRAAIRGLDPALEEAAATLDGRRSAFVRVLGPQLRPAIASGGLLVALYTFHDFGAVSLLRFDAFTNAIFLQYQSSLNRTNAAILSLVLIAVTSSLVILEVVSRGRAKYHRLSSTGGRRAAPTMPLGAWRWPAFGVCVMLGALSLVVPLAAIGYWLYRAALSSELFSIAALPAYRSIEASALGTALCVAAAIPVAMLAVRHRGPLAKAIEASSYVGHALPGVTVALSLVFFGARYVPVIYQTRWMLVFAYTVLFMPLALGGLRASLLQVSPQVEEAAQMLGSSRMAVLRRVTLPMIRPGVTAAGSLVFLSAMKELPATLMVAPIGYSTLAARVWSATNEVLYGQAAVYAAALVMLASIPLGILLLRDRPIH